MRALVIDDSRTMRLVLSRILKKMGFETEEAGDGKEALEKVKAAPRPYDLILVDWNMPVMNGIEFAKAFRADKQYDDVPLMMVTTETELGDVSKALEVGINEYVMKPFTEQVLQDKLELLGFALA